MIDLILRKGAERRLRGGHLWVYSNEVDTAQTPLGNFASGDVVRVCAAGGKLLGSAYMEPHSLICGRLFATGEERALDYALFRDRVCTALELRTRAFAEPCYRLVYGDSDLLPGIVVDRFDDVLVLQLNNPGLERYREELTRALVDVVAPTGILLRADSRARKERGGTLEPEVLFGDVPEKAPLQENGVHFYAPVYSGQKTGWFYDHRMARARLAGWVKGKSVLDVYSYIGGWGVQAAVFGASDVTCVDSSEAALDNVTVNAQLNGVEENVSTLRGAADQVLQTLGREGQRFDVIVLDPPAFIQRRKDIKKGITAYRRINELALRLLQPGGVLVSASCSMHLSPADLVVAMQQAAVRADCELRIVEQCGQGADHPVHPAIPETQYLKSVFAIRV